METVTPVVCRKLPALPAELKRALLLSQLLALGWWLVALWVRAQHIIPVWHDQQTTFTQLVHHVADPYVTRGFVNPPWAAVALAPFGLLPLEWSVLAQLCLYFALLAGVVFKFGGSLRGVVIALTSFLALDSALELNIDWVICLGLLVPVAWSAPLLLVKPQSALGYWLGLERKDLVRAVLVLLVLILISFVVWGGWLVPMLDAIRRNTLTRAYHAFNIAPLALLPAPLSLAIGAGLAYRAVRRHDPVLGIFAWLFFVPYITFYSLLPPFALAAARWQRLALIIHAVMWVIYGGVLARFFLGF